MKLPRYLFLWVVVAVVTGCAQPSRTTDPDRGPSEPASGQWYDLRDRLDPAFKADLEQALRNELPAVVGRLATSKKAGLVVVDFTDEAAPLVAEFDGERMNYAASLPKVAILYSAFVEIDRGDLVLDANLREQMTRMIRNSSNATATEVYERVGPARIAEILQADPHRLYDPAHGGGLWVGRAYGGEAWRRDPINGISHGASAMQVARFYYLLVTGQLVSPDSTAQMLDILSRPAVRHKFVIGLERDNPDARLYRKSGTWKDFHADSAIVIDPHYRYIVVALVEDPDGGAILEKLIGVVDRTVARRHVN